MRIGRGIIIPAILALGVAMGVLAGSEMATAATHAPSAHVQVSAASDGSAVMYHG